MITHRHIILLALTAGAAAPARARAEHRLVRHRFSKYPSNASLGNVEADFFEPWKWKTEYPNPAFLRMDAAARTLGDIIVKRRDKVVANWMTQSNPLDRFRVQSSPPEGTMLAFDNAAVRLGLADSMATYNVTWTSLDNLSGWESPMGTTWNSATPATRVPYDAWGPKDPSGARYAVARIETVHPRFPHWRMPVVVTMRDRNGVRDVVGIERPTRVMP